MGTWNAVSSLLIAVGVSGIISFTLRSVIKSAIEHRYKVEIENLKSVHALEMKKLGAELTMRTDAEREITARRLKAYPRIVELVYRIRNMCRDLTKRFSLENVSLLSELKSRAKELEETLYHYCPVKVLRN